MAWLRSGFTGGLVLAAKAGEQRRGRLADHAQELDGDRGVELSPAAMEHVDGLLCPGPLVVGETGQQILAAVDDPADRGGLFCRGDSRVASPVLQFGGRGPQALPVGEQASEVGAQLGKERRVGVKMSAAEALVPERAGLASR